MLEVERAQAGQLPLDLLIACEFELLEREEAGYVGKGTWNDRVGRIYDLGYGACAVGTWLA